MVTERFERWARNFAGCDGGNLHGRIWLCGIEYGGQQEDVQFDEVSSPPFVPPDSEAILREPYNRKALKLLAVLHGRSCSEYEDFYREHACFSDASNFFKLNLYPVAFKSTSHDHWNRWIMDNTGFSDKAQYLRWCQEHRFPVLRSWLARYVPKLVICTGTSHTEEFHSAFADKNAEICKAAAGVKVVKYFSANGGETLVAVIYFLGGRYGLNSNEKIWATGILLRNLMKEVAI